MACLRHTVLGVKSQGRPVATPAVASVEGDVTMAVSVTKGLMAVG